eukprot:CAMPEP_0197521582 /NCGR_PEP_ID=MMETSP1318-20131121/6847_1 /TAXON_ID=552666 /ORGANISM="Partenskyella glossopodia, Strain RCC365" /LENGTH=587 /DNA_ID=CAMNT_0043073635 /DNA_START=67 /DNA_END=1830 /DNA_ORIENTATION=+
MIGPFSVEEVGSKAWMRQHNLVEQLNIQAHQNALTRHDEYVVEALLNEDKIPTLIHHLLATEAWREKIFPLMHKEIQGSAAIKVYVALYHEATICNLLEVLLFHSNACESGGDAMCELAEYCYRKLLRLSTKAIVPPKPEGKLDLKQVSAMESESEADALSKQVEDISFSTAMSCITLMRFLTEHVHMLPVSVPRQLLDNLDVLMVLVPLMEASPWQRRSSSGIEKYVENKWMKIERKDRFRLSKIEAQVWLSIYNLLMDKGCRTLYDFTNYRKEVLMRLKRYMNDLLKDQLPILKDLQRLLEELSLMKMPAPAKPLHLVVPVSLIRESIYMSASTKKDRTEDEWSQIAKSQLAGPFSANHKDRAEEMRALAETYGGGVMEALIEDPKCARCGKPATNRCSRCQHEWYCSRKCQLKSWKKHKTACGLLASAISNKKQQEKEMKKRNENMKREASKGCDGRGGTVRVEAAAGGADGGVPTSTQPKVVEIVPEAAVETDVDGKQRQQQQQQQEEEQQQQGKAAPKPEVESTKETTAAAEQQSIEKREEEEGGDDDILVLDEACSEQNKHVEDAAAAGAGEELLDLEEIE